MPVGLRFARGAMKPPPGALIDPDHPFSRGLSFVLPLNDGGIYPLTDTIGPEQFTSQIIPVGAPSDIRSITWGRGSTINTNFWSSNKAGRCMSFPEGWGVGFLDGRTCYMTDKCVIAFVRRKIDTNVRVNAPFYHSDVDGSHLIAYAPWSTGAAFWFFGGSGTFLTVAGVPISTEEERWIFVEDPQRGPSIWRNGIKLASNSTPRTRTTDLGTGAFVGNRSSLTQADLQEMNFLQVADTAWSDEECRWWSAEPYAHLYSPEALRRYFFFAHVDAAADLPRRPPISDVAAHRAATW